MTLPAATLDHVVINARDDMDRAADVYRRLGFTLTERGYHSLGSMNHLAMFGTDYLAPGQAVPQFELFEQKLTNLPAEVKAKLFRENARKLLGLTT